MLATLLVLVVLGQPEPPVLFHWLIEGLGEPHRTTVTVTVYPTPFGLTQGAEVTAVHIAPVPTRTDRQPRAISPLATEPALTRGLRASFPMPGRRFHLVVTLADGSTHTIDVYRPVPPSPPATPQPVYPLRLLAPVSRWTAHQPRDHGVLSSDGRAKAWSATAAYPVSP